MTDRVEGTSRLRRGMLMRMHRKLERRAAELNRKWWTAQLDGCERRAFEEKAAGMQRAAEIRLAAISDPSSRADSGKLGQTLIRQERRLIWGWARLKAEVK